MEHPDLPPGTDPRDVEVYVEGTWRRGHLVATSRADGEPVAWHVTYLDEQGRPRTHTARSSELRTPED